MASTDLAGLMRELREGVATAPVENKVPGEGKRQQSLALAVGKRSASASAHPPLS